MSKDKDNLEKGEASGRDFLVGAGADVVGGAIGAGIPYPLMKGKGSGEVPTVTSVKTVPTTVTSTTTVDGGETATTTAPKRAVELWQEPETTVVKSLSLSGVGGELSAVDVKNGKIVRIRPLHYDWKYTKEKLVPWKLEARGKT